MREARALVAAMLVCSMHPTVLHEDSTLISGDFPAMTRQYLQEHVLGKDCPVLYHTGPCGNQSPRHVTKANTFDEAERLGGLAGPSRSPRRSTRSTMPATLTLGCRADDGRSARAAFSRRSSEAQKAVGSGGAAAGNASPVGGGSPRSAHGGVRLVRRRGIAGLGPGGRGRTAASGDRLGDARRGHADADRALVVRGLAGRGVCRVLAEVKAPHPNCYVISLANGELQGYLVTEEAVRERWYEAMNSLFASPEAGMALVGTTLELLDDCGAA